MNFQTLIKELEDAELPVKNIAALTETKASTISALKRGQNKFPNWRTGDRLIRLHRKRCPDSSLHAEQDSQ